MARCRSRRRPRWTPTIPPPPASRSRACSRRRARRDCSRDELVPDPPHAPAASNRERAHRASNQLVPDPPHAPAASYRRAAPAGAGDAPRSLAARVAPVRVSRQRRAARGRPSSGRLPDLGGRARQGRGAGAPAGPRWNHAVWLARGQGRYRLRGLRRAGCGTAGGARREARRAGAARDRGRVPVRVHRSRPLRGDPGRRRGQRRVRVPAGQGRGDPGARGRRHRGTERHDGRPGGGHSRVPIMADAAKTASAFYGPFREAAGSTPQFGDRQTYQMQGGNADEAMKEIRLDVEEGADIVLVKPALPCLDLVRRAKQEFGSPLAAYQVSGEYAMIKAAAARGMLDETRAMWETLYAIRRAGADIILSYFAPTVAELL